MSTSPLPIRFTGIRNDDIITTTPGQNQNKGTVIKIRGYYPPSKPAIKSIDRQKLVEGIHNINTLKNLNDDDKIKTLKITAVDNDDLYMSDLDNFYIKFIKIGGKGFIDKLTKEQID